jgi:hypothetical protein
MWQIGAETKKKGRDASSVGATAAVRTRPGIESGGDACKCQIVDCAADQHRHPGKMPLAACKVDPRPSKFGLEPTGHYLCENHIWETQGGSDIDDH